jgi:oxygen-dependent protoporphyrinogen oxidase
LQPEVFALDEPEMARRVEADLRELLGIREVPRFVELSKWERSMPQYEVGHLDRVNEIETLLKQLPGLALAGNAYRGAGIPDCIRSGEAAAEALLQLTKPSTDYAESV